MSNSGDFKRPEVAGDDATRHEPSSYEGNGTPGVARANGGAQNKSLFVVEQLKRSEMQPSYAQVLDQDSEVQGCYGAMINCLGSIAGTLGSIPCCFCCPNPYKEVKQGSVGLVSKFGRFYKATDPGLVKINPLSESLRHVDVKIQIAVVPRQTCMTKDNVSVELDSVLYFHITNPYRAAFAISDVRVALLERAQTTLRHVVGSRVLQSVITDRETIAVQVEEIVESAASAWGVQIESLLIKDIIFNQDLQASLSSAAQQKRIGESKVIAARAEVDSARLMREAADILSSPAAIQIRSLEALQAMARTANTKVIFVPMQLQQSLDGGASSQAVLTGGNVPYDSGSGDVANRAALLSSAANI